MHKIPDPVAQDGVLIPKEEIRELHYVAELSVDVFVVNGLPLILTLWTFTLQLLLISLIGQSRVFTTHSKLFCLERGFQVTLCWLITNLPTWSKLWMNCQEPQNLIWQVLMSTNHTSRGAPQLTKNECTQSGSHFFLHRCLKKSWCKWFSLGWSCSKIPWRAEIRSVYHQDYLFSQERY